MPSNHLILCRPLLLPSIFPSIRVFASVSVLHIRWPKYWNTDSLQPHELQHTRLPCPPLSPRVCSSSCLLHQPSHPLPSSSFASIRELFSSEYSGLVSFRIDWFDLLAVQGTLQHNWKHQFFSVQPSVLSNCHIHTWLLEKPLLSLYGTLVPKWCLFFLIWCLGLS